MRCANCGSKDVTLIKNDKYSFSKGAVGVLAFGTIGAVAGIGAFL